jgi:hypothetical protein
MASSAPAVVSSATAPDLPSSRFRQACRVIRSIESTLFIVFFCAEIFVVPLAGGLGVAAIVEFLAQADKPPEEPQSYTTAACLAAGFIVAEGVAIYLYKGAWGAAKSASELSVSLLELATGQRDHRAMALKKLELEGGTADSDQGRLVELHRQVLLVSQTQITSLDRRADRSASGDLPLPLLTDAEIRTELSARGEAYSAEAAIALLEARMQQNNRQLVRNRLGLLSDVISDALFATVKLCLMAVPIAMQLGGAALVVAGQEEEPEPSDTMTVLGIVFLSLSPLALCIACCISAALKKVVAVAIENAFLLACRIKDSQDRCPATEAVGGAVGESGPAESDRERQVET